MSKSPKEMWVEALRSGKYQQCPGVLCDGHRYCCLGVLCEVFNEATGTPVATARRRLLPRRVADWCGLRTTDGGFGDEETLAGLNDTGKSFEHIADIIESNPPGLFVTSDEPRAGVVK